MKTTPNAAPAPAGVPDLTDGVRRVSYGLACAAVEQLLADAPVLPAAVEVECTPADPTIGRVVLDYGRRADLVRRFAAAMGVRPVEREHADGSRHTACHGRLDTTPYTAVALIPGGVR